MKDNPTMVLSHLVAALDIPLTRKTLSDELKKHPNFASLLSLSDVLTNWNVPNAAYQIDFDDLPKEIDGEFIAVTSKNKFLLVNKIDDKKVLVSNEVWKKHVLDIKEFKNMYGGMVLIAEKDETSGDLNYTAKHRKEIVDNLRLPVVVVTTAVLLFSWLFLKSSYFVSFNIQIALLTLFKTLGLITAVLLIIQSIDTNNPLIQKLCGSDKTKSCNAILSSKSAKVTDELSWSEVGLFYFSGTWLVLLFNSDSPSVLFWLALLNLVSLPYTFYSIYYQFKIAKQWCKLCCTVQVLLWLEFFSFLPSLSNGLIFPDLGRSLSIVSGIAAPILGWILIKPYLLLSREIQPLKGQLRLFKYDKELFNSRLAKEPRHPLINDEDAFIFGNKNAETTITIVSNPYCSLCTGMHYELKQKLQTSDNIKVQILFIVGTDDEDARKVVSHMVKLKLSGNDALMHEAIDNWYEGDKGYTKWHLAHKAPDENIDTNAIINAQKKWSDMTVTYETPTVFINGVRLPHPYQFSDLKYLI